MYQVTCPGYHFTYCNIDVLSNYASCINVLHFSQAQSKVSIDVASQDLLQTSSCLGANTLLKLLGNYCRSQDMKTAITVGIVGFPNVGKSSVINSLKRSKACNVGSTPGLTK